MTTPQARSHQDNDVIELGVIFAILSARRWLILLLTAVVFAGVDGSCPVGDLLSDGLEGVRRTDFKVHAIEREVFGGRSPGAQRPNALSR